MNIHHLVYFCFLSVLTEGNTGHDNVETLIYAEGEKAVAECYFSLSGRKKFLCKDECTTKDILVETTGDAAQSGRYSIEYKAGTFPVSSTVVHVTITQLTKSDAGRYRCVLERPIMPDSYCQFEIRVTNDPSQKQPKTFPETMKQSGQQQNTASYPAYGLPLAIGVTVLFATVVLLFYKWNIRMDSNGLISRGQSEDRNMEFAVCEKCAPDSTVPHVDEPCSNEDKIYCNL